MSFKDTEDMYDIIGGFFESVKDSDETKEMMKNNEDEMDDSFDAIVTYIYHHPEGKMTWVAGENNTIELVLGDTDRIPELEFEQSADVGNQFWQGKLDLAQALARQQIVPRGPLAKAMKIVPQMDWIYPAYRQFLKEKGREDLLL